MGKFEPSEREKCLVFKSLPATKESLINTIMQTNMDEKYARSLIWNMRRLALIYTGDNNMIGKV